MSFLNAGDAEVFVELFVGFLLAMGAGIACIYAVLLLFNNALQPITIARNSGYGIYLGSTEEISRSTVTENGQYQIEFYSSALALQLRNSVVVGGLAACGDREAGTSYVADYNLYSDQSCTSDSDDDHSEHGVADPGFGEFGNWGGPTPTYELLPGSIAIDNAPGSLCGGADQRGLLRPVAHEGNAEPRCDTGAVELESSVVIPPEEPWVPEIFFDSFESCDGC